MAEACRKLLHREVVEFDLNSKRVGFKEIIDVGPIYLKTRSMNDRIGKMNLRVTSHY